MSTARAQRTRTSARKAPPAVTCRMVTRPVCPCELMPFGSAGLVEIQGEAYDLEVNAELPAEGEPVVYGFRCTKRSDAARSYDLPYDLSSCECMGQLRYGYCRHQSGLRQLRQKGQI